MPLDARLRQRLDQALGVVDDHGTPGLRLLDDAARTWRRVKFFISLQFVSDGLDLDALELACYAMQLPLRRSHPISTSRRSPRTNLRTRAEEGAEMLIALAAEGDDVVLLDRATRVLHETHQRSPMLEESRLLADAINLEDFGVTGLLHQMIQLTRQGDGISQLASGCQKREQYGYWEARLKDGFHFEPVREMARRRLDSARLMCAVLLEELNGDAS